MSRKKFLFTIITGLTTSTLLGYCMVQNFIDGSIGYGYLFGTFMIIIAFLTGFTLLSSAYQKGLSTKSIFWTKYNLDKFSELNGYDQIMEELQKLADSKDIPQKDRETAKHVLYDFTQVNKFI